MAPSVFGSKANDSMLKKWDKHLIDIVLIAMLLFLLSNTSPLWIGLVEKIIRIVVPVFFGFGIAYALYPYLQKLRNIHIPKGLGVVFLIFIVIFIIAMVLILLIPLLTNQIVNFISSLLFFIKDLSLKYSFDFAYLEDLLLKQLQNMITNVGSYVSVGAFKTISTSIQIVTSVFISFISSVYFLLDMDKIRESIKNGLLKHPRIYRYLQLLDKQIKQYIKGFLQIAGISFVEYTLAYLIIGHPNFLLIGILSGLANFIPFFGGLVVGILASVTAFMVSPVLCLKVLILSIICNSLDNFIINPLVYKKSNRLHPLVVIIATFGGGILFGLSGIIISLPLAIVIISTYQFYKEIKS